MLRLLLLAASVARAGVVIVPERAPEIATPRIPSFPLQAGALVAPTLSVPTLAPSIVVPPSIVAVPARQTARIAPSALAVAKLAAVSVPHDASDGKAKDLVSAAFDAYHEGNDHETEDVHGAESTVSPLAADEGGEQRSEPDDFQPPTPAPVVEKAPFFVRHYRLASFVLRPLVRLLYSTRVSGLENLPVGPAVFIPNHVSYVDAIILSYAADRPMRFLMKRSIYEKAPRLMKALGAIPVSSKDSPAKIEESLEAARRAIRAGQSVAIFPEGQLTLTGNMIGFRRGFERIVEKAPAPVIPAYMDGLWGSVFSMQKGPSFWSRVRELPRPLSVRFGPALEENTAQAARLAVSELGADAMGDRVRRERKTLAREFFARAKRSWKSPSVSDSTGVELDYGKALTGSVLLGRALDKELGPGKNVAVLVPPTVGGALANVALASVGRVAVNLNYTAKPDAVAHAVKTADIDTVVTSKRALQALKDERGFELPPGLKLVFLEDVQASIPEWRKKAAFLALKLLPRALAEAVFIPKASRDLEDTATILFTSGSSSLPKGVVLSHLNVLSDLEMVRQILPWAERDAVLGVLPFFHSFGYTVTLWMPLVSGMSAAYHTHPTKTEAIEKLALRTKPTLLLGTPAFLETYAKKISKEAFAHLRLAIAGAEKLRDSVADLFERKFGLRPYEGYGATELSPVASAGTPSVGSQKGTKPGSVGRALPGTAVKAVDLKTGKTVPEGEVGMLMVKGPQVMKGYLGQPEKTAEVVTKDGWYVTGDLGSVDRDGFITISGRMSRFSKLAGEMVSHVAVEEEMHKAAGRSELTFVVTGGKDEKRGEKLVVLYAGWDGSVDELLTAMRKNGVPNLWLPSRAEFHRIDSIPLLGTGKLDLAAVNALAASLARP